MTSIKDALTAYDAAPIGIVMTENRIIMTCNKTFADMLGYQPDELIGQSFRMLYGSQEEFTRIRDIGLAPLRASGSYTDERMVRHRDGGSVWCRFRAHSMTPESPLAKVVMSFAQISDSGETISLSTRQRQVLGHMARGLTSK